MNKSNQGWVGRFPRNEIISLLEVNRSLNLAESTSQDLNLGEIFDLAPLDELRQLRLGYGTSCGLPALRATIGKMINVPEDWVISTTGAVLGLALLAIENVQKDDEVVLVTPCFPPSRDLLLGLGAKVVQVPLTFNDGYQLNPERISTALSSKTKLVCLASPQNPSGVQTTTEALTQILKSIKSTAPDAKLFVDETYSFAAYGTDAIAPSSAGLDPLVLTGSSISKAFGAPGLRVGWLTVPDPDLRERIAVAKMNIVISGSVVDETLATTVLKNRDAILGPRRTLLEKGLKIVEQWQQIERKRIDWVRPSAGALCCMRLNEEIFSDSDVEKFWLLLPDLELQLANGEWFGETRRVFRLGFGYLSLSMLSEALRSLSTALDKTQQLQKI